MNILDIRVISGPNVYIDKPVAVMRLDLQECADRDTFVFPGLSDRLLALCPGLYEHHCAMGRPGGFVERLYGGTYLGHVVEHVALELLTRAGCEANFGKTRQAGQPGVYNVIVECPNEPVVRSMLRAAVAVVEACVSGAPCDVSAYIRAAAQLHRKTRLGPSTEAILAAARRRSIPAVRVGQRSVLQLGTGRYRRLLQATMTDRTSAVGVDIASDKDMAKTLLRGVGIRVPDGGIAHDQDEAQQLFERIGAPVVVKPLLGSKGRGVTTNVSTVQELRDAFERASDGGDTVIVEQHVRGVQVRLLVIGERVAAAAVREPARVFGDGLHTIAQLVDIENANPLRGEGHECPLTRLRLDAAAHRWLRAQGWEVDGVPADGACVHLLDSANLSTGGTARDVTDEVHPELAALAVRAARTLGLDIAGVDLIVGDVAAPPALTTCVALEVNAAPGIRMHLYPSAGSARPVADDIVEHLFPSGAPSRIPVVSVTGTNGKTTTTRLVAHLLAGLGITVGMTTTDGIFIGDRCVERGDTTGPRSARVLLSDPAVDAAVLETARGGIMRDGLGYDLADVGVITNITEDHIGQDGLESIDDIFRVKSVVAEQVHIPTGLVVLNADDPLLCNLVAKLRAPVALVSLRPDHTLISRHLSRGGKAYFLQDGWLMEAAGALLWRVAHVRDVPLTMSGAAHFHIANALCALAAARHIGVDRARCREALATFTPHLHNPGRIDVFELPGGPMVVSDYGHNPDGVRVVGEFSRRIAGRKVPAVIGFPGDRADAVIRAAARAAAEYFDPVFVKEDVDTRGRRRGEVADIIAREVRACQPDAHVAVVLDECEAVCKALDANASQPYLFVFHEQRARVDAVLAARGAVRREGLPELHAESAGRNSVPAWRTGTA
ncbi:MAG: cyanophycin synthetase [Firmicutes bacterium]|nr:cyanophycin synthetase [Bacillota bacterium]